MSNKEVKVKISNVFMLWTMSIWIYIKMSLYV